MALQIHEAPIELNTVASLKDDRFEAAIAETCAALNLLGRRKQAPCKPAFTYY
jgi:hypothetical protein